MIQPMVAKDATALVKYPKSSKMGAATEFSAMNGRSNIVYSRSAQDVSVKSYKRRLNELEKELKECKRENYETFEEYVQEKQFIMNEYENVQKLMNEHDARYTEVNTDAQNKTIGAIGGFIKDIGSALKNVGSEIINTIGSWFGLKPGA